MTKFIEVIIDGKTHAINIDNIAMIKQIDADITEFHLLTKNADGQISFRVAYNYGHFRYLLDNESRLGFNVAFNEFK